MPMIRVNALRSLRFTGARATARASAGRTQLVAKRFASSGGSHGGHGEPSSDLPWLLSALAITPPSVWYLWPDKSHAEHHGDHGHDEEHAEEEEKPSEEDQSADDEAEQVDSAPAEQADASEKTEEKAEQSAEKPEDKSEGGEEKSEGGEEKKEGGDEKKEGGEEKPADGEEKSDGGDEKEQGGDEKEEGSEDSGESDDSAGNEDGPQKKERTGKVEGVQFKGRMKPDSDGHNDTRKTEPNPESRKTQKRRIDSGLGKNLGEGDQPSDQSSAKPESSDVGDISNKQKGFSTTDTRHSIKIDERDDKSKKGTGEPETAKAKGTIDPSAPVRGGPAQNAKQAN